MKGMELPISMIVVIAVAVLVLVVIAAFFLNNFNNNGNSLNLESALVSGCNVLRQFYNCDAARINEVKIPGFKVGTNECTLGYACYKKGLRDAMTCLKQCGCDTDQVLPGTEAPRSTCQ